MSHKNKKPIHPRSYMIGLGAFFALCFIIGVAFYHLVEGFSVVNSFYFTAMTLTTVGYGDIAPHSDAGKIFTSIFAFIGVATFLGFASAIFQASLLRHKKHLW